MKRRIALAAGLTALLVVVLLVYFLTRASAPGPPVIVVIETGMSLPVIADLLEEKGVIASREGFIALTAAKGLAGRLRAGEFRIPRGKRPENILRILVSGPVVQHRITVPEGFDFSHILALMRRSGIASENAAAGSAVSQLAKELGLPTDSLEGYLFPDTYYFNLGEDAKQLLRRMVERFFQVFDEGMKERATALGMSLHQVVTLASIVEKEASHQEERALIAGVFYNRLRRKMRLQSDPTVIYGLGAAFTGRLRKKDLENSSPYNTYRITGLPPGPIASPGKASLEAALWPRETRAIYFVARNDGTHVFSESYRDHIKAVNKYQR